MIPFISIYLYFSRVWFFSFIFFCSLFFSAQPFSFFSLSLDFLVQLEDIVLGAVVLCSHFSFLFFFIKPSFHFLASLMPLVPLFPFPAKEHVVFIFYFDDSRSVVLYCWFGCRSFFPPHFLLLLFLLQMLFVLFCSTLLLKAPLQYIK